MQIANNVLVEVDDSDLTNGTLPYLYHYRNLTSIGNFAFEGCSNLITLILPKSISSIGEFAFKGCSNLITLTLPQSLTSIGEGAFYDCSSLITLILPQNLAYIGDGAFSCSSLCTITLPQGLRSIGDFAFEGSSNLITLILHQGLTSIGADAFNYCSNLSTIIVMADSDADFARINALLPQELQSFAYNGSKQALIERLNDLEKLLQDKPNGIKDEKDLAEIETIMNKADAHLERISTIPSAYAEQKKIIDSLFIKILVHQNHIIPALAYYLDNRVVDELSINQVAAICYAIEDNHFAPDLKAQAMIALFKNHVRLEGINTLMTQTALYLLRSRKKLRSGEPKPRLSDKLSNHGIERCAPLSLIHSTAQTAVNTLDDTNPLKEMLLAILAQLEHLTRQELLHLFSLSPIQEALVANPVLNSAMVMPFESLYKKEPTPRELHNDLEHFIATTLERIGTEKRSTQDTIEFIEEHAISQLKATLEVLKGKPVPLPTRESSGTSPQGFFTDTARISISAEDEPSNSPSLKGK